MTQILSAKIHPEIFITDDSFTLINHYMHFKRYGINFLYPQGYNEIPDLVLRAFDVIQNVIDKDESDRLKAIKENNQQKKQTN